ncbi:hypothetical protein JG688_00004078 [Phytophthora aleatoria]|uniref:HAT C-terminal dimerisation domain-containing protein n=1 Tax=Phytophthora aleatoria TaxID=2496075 RepID=A0A8J5J195_9STRA|nr:hypothetical protein JG688_00004078 [Phytophthora aleatoria]
MRVARLVAVPLVGCASYRLNLAVCILLDPHEKELEQAQSLMKRLRTLSQAAKLRLKTHLRPPNCASKRGGSTYAVLARYFESSTQEEEPTQLGLADRILKRRKVQAKPSTYVLLAEIPPTSHNAERLFRMARMIMRYERNRLSPLKLERLLFLKENSSYWDVTTVDAVI